MLIRQHKLMRATGGTQGGATFSIFDADFPKNIWETLPPPMLDDRPMTEDDPEYPRLDHFRSFAPNDWMESVRCAQEMGGIKSAGTIEDLANVRQHLLRSAGQLPL